MVFDQLSRHSLYRPLHPRFGAAFDWLLAFDPKTPDGRHAIAGDDIFALVQSFTTGPANEKEFETHRDRIDIQYVFEGLEQMLCVRAEGLTVRTPYDPARDIAFYHDPADYSSLVCAPGSFAIFFPHDAHKPTCAVKAPVPARKVVVKIRV